MPLRNLISFIKTTIGGCLVAALLKLISTTIRWGKPVGCTEVPNEAAIVAFWHGRMLMMPALYRRVWPSRKRIAYVLISQHGDGRLIALAVRLLGLHSVAGSSTRGGRRALLDLIRKGRDGADLSVTPDGPRGPRHVCKEGVAVLAQKAEMPLYAFSYSVDRKWQLRSWDGMIIPKPFARGVVVVSEPVVIEHDVAGDVALQRVQEALDNVTRQADAYWSHT